MTRYYTVSGHAGTVTIAAKSTSDAKAQYRSETGRSAIRAEKA